MMRRVLAVVSAVLLGHSSAAAAEIHLSHFGQVMVSVPWIIALEQDLFRKNGVDVTDVITSQGGGTTLRNMLAGGVPFADAAIGATVTGFAAGLPIRIIGATTSNAADNDWVVPADSPVKSLRDVVGGKFGTTTPGGLTRVYGEMLLRHHGIDPAQVTQVPLGVGSAVAALNSGAVDTAYMYEPLQSKYGSKYRARQGIGRPAARCLQRAGRLPGLHRERAGQAARHYAGAQTSRRFRLRSSEGSRATVVAAHGQHRPSVA
jgi:NitT/TauT family transport system substrate-binding protein